MAESSKAVLAPRRRGVEGKATYPHDGWLGRNPVYAIGVKVSPLHPAMGGGGPTADRCAAVGQPRPGGGA